MKRTTKSFAITMALAMIALMAIISPESAHAQTPATQGPSIVVVQEPTTKWEDLSVQKKKEALRAGVEEGNQALTETAKTFHAIRDKYPFNGVGVSWSLSVKQKEDQGATVGVQIVAVWKGSPAEQAGIQPDDWAVQVNEVKLGTVFIPKDRFSEAKALVAPLDVLLDGAIKSMKESQSSITLSLERAGVAKTYTLTKAAVGEELGKFVSAKFSGWKKVFEDQKAAFAQLAQDIDKAGEDGKKLDACYETIKNIAKAMQEPEAEFQTFLDTQVKSLAPP